PWSETPFSKHSFLFFSAASHDSGHNHHDYFTFEWSERGVPIVVDSGKFTYNRGRERDFFVSTRAGNTVEIDGKNHKPLKALSHLRGFGRAGPLHFAEASARHGSKVQHTRLLVLRM